MRGEVGELWEGWDGRSGTVDVREVEAGDV